MIRRASKEDIQAIADIDRVSFSGNKPVGIAEKWITVNFERKDQYHYFVCEKDGRVCGFIGWEIKNGFARGVPVVELEKLAVPTDFRGQGVGTELVDESFPIMKEWVQTQQPEATEMRIIVWSLKENEKAIQLYKNICNEGIQGERSIFSSPEVLLRGTYQL